MASILTKRAKGELPFSDQGWSRWRLAKIMIFLQFLWFMGALIGGTIEASTGDGAIAIVLFVSMLAVPLAIYFAFQRNKMVVPTRITETEITIKIPSEQAAMVIREHLTAGHVVQAQPLAAAHAR